VVKPWASDYRLIKSTQANFRLILRRINLPQVNRSQAFDMKSRNFRKYRQPAIKRHGQTLPMLRGAASPIFALLITLLAGCGQKELQPGIIEASNDSRRASEIVPEGYRGRVAAGADVTAETVNAWQASGWNGVVLFVDGATELDQVTDAVKLLSRAGFSVEYFVEVARCVEMAELHPEWMGSIQGHDEWRRLYPDLRPLGVGEVVKVWPWVPVLYRETFDAHIARLSGLLKALPVAKRVWLHDLQGSPSACGCGHPLCRWTTDYGEVRTATMLDENAAAEFLKEIGSRFPETHFVPVWVTECEAADEHEACGGVGCFEGLCWKKWAEQLEHVASQSPVMGASCLYKVHDRDLARYGEEAAWVAAAIGLFEAIPGEFDGAGVESARIVAALQGWDVTESEIEAQVSAARDAGVRGTLLVTTPVEQSWKPVILDIASKKVVRSPGNQPEATSSGTSDK
jgi:hypothetical protein